MELIDKKKYTADEKSHRDYFNHIVGIITFTITLTCLSFDNPQKVALLCFPIVLALLLGAPEFKSLKDARNLIELAENDHDKKLLEAQLKKETGPFLKFRELFQMAIYFYGLIFYILVATKPEITNYLKSISWVY
ncbi:hypothetical protein V5H05_18170 [Vibrio cholerae]|uniref:hypothetical protein n=1 Tax=Vibrio cholerae TaxID=666 RepID=UPI003966F480